MQFFTSFRKRVRLYFAVYRPHLLFSNYDNICWRSVAVVRNPSKGLKCESGRKAEHWREIQQNEENHLNQVLHALDVLPIFLYQLYNLAGVVVGFYAGFLHNVIKNSLSDDLTTSQTDSKISIVFIALGVAEFIGGVSTGLITDAFKDNKKMIGVASTIMV